MPVGAVHVNVPLSNLGMLYRPLDGFIADEVCPILPVVHESDVYYTWTQGDFFATDVSDLVPDKTEPRAIEFAATRRPTRCPAARARVGHLRPRAQERRQPAPPRAEQAGRHARPARAAPRDADRGEAPAELDVTTTVAGESITGGSTRR
jgi:hypothetical protein